MFRAIVSFFGFDKSQLTHHQRIKAIRFPYDSVPDKYISRMNHEIMDIPLQLDGVADHIVDEKELIKWWGSSGKTDINPFTNERLEKKSVLTELQKEIRHYVSSLELIHNQIGEIEKIIDSHQNQDTYRDRLLNIGLTTDHIPAQFIGINLIDNVITHPVILDKKYVVDYLELEKWWKRAPENQYKNFFTNCLLTSITYDKKLKHEIYTYVYLEETKRKARYNPSLFVDEVHLGLKLLLSAHDAETPNSSPTLSLRHREEN